MQINKSKNFYINQIYKWTKISTKVEILIKKKKILLAYSGGQDSINLIILWFQILNYYKKIHIGILWCNHLWKFENLIIFKYNLKISFLFNSPFKYTIILKPNLTEEKARFWRYKSFNRILTFYNYNYIVTAHCLSDQLETFFINLFRGSSNTGLVALKELNLLKNYDYHQRFYYKKNKT